MCSAHNQRREALGRLCGAVRCDAMRCDEQRRRCVRAQGGRTGRRSAARQQHRSRHRAGPDRGMIARIGFVCSALASEQIRPQLFSPLPPVRIARLTMIAWPQPRAARRHRSTVSDMTTARRDAGGGVAGGGGSLTRHIYVYRDGWMEGWMSGRGALLSRVSPALSTRSERRIVLLSLLLLVLL